MDNNDDRLLNSSACNIACAFSCYSFVYFAIDDRVNNLNL